MMCGAKLFMVAAGTAFVLGLTGCHPKQQRADDASKTGPHRQEFEVKGVIKELKPNGKTAVIAHEEIPNYMEAMTMDFDVKDTNELRGLRAGDEVLFRLVVTKDDGWIEKVRRVGAPDPSMTSGNATNTGPLNFRKAPVVEPLEVGDQVPNYKFTNQLGQPISLHQFHGQALGVTFIFTRCPFPTFCPRMSSNFQQAHNKLLAMQNAPTNWFLLSISFDPERDTPEVLRKYAETYAGGGGSHWQFATSDFWNIDGITEQLGLQFWKDQGSINHNLRTAVIDTRGRLQKVFTGNEWQVDDFVAEMAKAARVK